MRRAVAASMKGGRAAPTSSLSEVVSQNWASRQERVTRLPSALLIGHEKPGNCAPSIFSISAMTGKASAVMPR